MDKKIKFLSVLLVAVISFAVVFSGCKKRRDDLSDSSDAGSASYSASKVSSDYSFVPKSDSFDYNPPSTAETSKEPASDGAIKNYPVLNAVYSLGIIDGTYNGTDKNRGFPSRKTRTDGTFTTYPVGYGEGTTGGRGATPENVYVCSTGLEVMAARDAIKEKQKTDSQLKSIIKITAEINQRNTTADVITEQKQFAYQIIIDSIDNLTIIGANSNAVFNGVGINFKSCDNVIVQNVTIHHPSAILKNEKDCLEFNTCNYVWVDHCELYNDYPSNSAEKNYYDGLIDVKNVSSHVTISYNYLHDAFKTSLVGSGPDDLCETRTVTYHHNIFKNLYSRVPAFRSGFAHIYNNYYENIIGSSANCRIGAEVYIENNRFVNAKKPVCADEDAIKGYYNISEGNYFDSSCRQVISPSASTTDFTPSYEYVLDDATGLEDYLNQTVGVNKIDVSKQCAMDPGYGKKYEISQEMLIDRAISELPEIKLIDDVKQRLLYLSKVVLFASEETQSKITKISELETAAQTFISLFATDWDSRVSKVNFSGEFGSEALNYLALKTEYDKADKIVKGALKNVDAFEKLTAEYAENLKTYFNSSVKSLVDAEAEELQKVENLLDLYSLVSESEKEGLDYDSLKQAYISGYGHVKAEEFEALASGLPKADNVTFSDDAKVMKAIAAYENLTEKQYSFVKADVLTSFEDFYVSLKKTSRKMDLSAVNAGKVLTDAQVAGGVALSKNTEVVKSGINVSFNKKTYNQCAYISGYGNRGSKSLRFTVYGDSEIKIVLASLTAGCKFTVSDADGNVIKTYSVEDNTVTEISVTGLTAGEYRFYTAMPAQGETIYTDSKAYVYEFSIFAK